jgi:dTMP kinase
MFITIYGINNIGKTYHARRLAARLQKLGKKTVFIKYPIYSQKPTGPFLNKILRSHGKQRIKEEELQLWFVLNRYQFEPKLKQMLSDGKIVVAEDYIGTGIAWGTAKGASRGSLENMNKFLVQPDTAILLEGQRKLAAREKKHLHERDDLLAAKCQKIYRKLAKKYGWKVIKVDPDRDVTAARIWRNFKNLI